MPTQSITKEYGRWPLRVDEQGVRRLYDELQTILEASSNAKIQFHVEYTDNSSADDISLDDLVRDENSSSRRIRAIRVDANNDDYKISIKIGHEKKIKDEVHQVSSVLLEVSGPTRQAVFVAQSVIEDRINSFSANRPGSGPILLGYLVCCLAFFSTLLVYETSILPHLPKTLTALSPADGHVHFAFWFLLAFVAPMIGGIFFLLVLFPDLEFLIGKGIERHRRNQTIKANLFWVVIVGGVLSLIVGYYFYR